MNQEKQPNAVDYEAHPESYPLEMDDAQALNAMPYAARLLPHWRYGNADDAAISAAELYEWYTRFKERGDFIGMDIVRRLLRLAKTRARLAEANAPLPSGGPLRPTAAAIFSKTFRMVDNDPDLVAMREAHAARRRGQSPERDG